MLLGLKLSTAVLLIAILPGLVSSDDESSPRPYITAAKGGAFYFKMSPDSSDQYNRDKGNGAAFRVTLKGCDQKMWTTEGWYAFSTYLTSDGQYLVRLGNWPRGTEPSHDDLAIAFYQNGKLIKAYSTRELIADDSKVEVSTSHYRFFKGTPRFSEQTDFLFELQTVDEILYTFDIREGKIKSKN